MRTRIAGRRKSLWAYFPWFLAAAMLAVAVVNTAFIIDAVQSFPGAAGDDGFDLSNSYDRVLDTAAAQRALGWRIEVAVSDGRVAVKLADPAGRPLAHSAVSATAARPLGPPDRRVLDFAEADGRYVATEGLTPGQWDVALRIGAQGHDVRVTRRVIIP